MKKEFKKIGLLFLFGIMISSCGSDPDPAASCLPANLQSGLIAFYPFSTGSLNDASGNGYNLTNSTTATPGPDRAGNATCAFNFVKANGDYLTFQNPTFLNGFATMPFSISIWYKPIGTRNVADYELLIGRDRPVSPLIPVHCPDTYGQWSVGLYDCRRSVIGINDTSLWDGYFDPSICDITLANLSNFWQHLVVTSSSSGLTLYRNGVLTTDPVNSGCIPAGTTLDLGDLFLGKEYTGLLDDVIIYNRVLSVAEITQLYSLPACCQ